MKKFSVILFAGLCLVGCNSATTVKQQPAANGEVLAFQVDGLNVTWIQDNAGERLMPVRLFPEADSALIDSLGVRNGVPSSVSTFLLQIDGKNLLFDTGLGGSNGNLERRLDSLGLPASKIDYLFITHFHGDHIGGMLKGDTVVFANAQVYAAQPEYDAWVTNAQPGQNAQQINTMKAYEANLHLFNFGDTLPMDVVAIDAKGHTPGHTAFQRGRLLVVGDLMHGAALQMANPEICASFDADKPAAVESRRRLLQYAADNNLVMVGMHLPQLKAEMFK